MGARCKTTKADAAEPTSAFTETIFCNGAPPAPHFAAS